ncbi:divergent PAP2 family protein [Paenibacillus rhizovicinus]|uniref:Divergent PAP2 family protein n=1 Tax=Paenibacillus rhizovicinus TaxID=2704463 RepID=A0A6C0P597_9BACL|nr:divergent PAP2 family protein [Paenibacillus rhizovicinus]QHW33647.1 divergent PAP2 family protein [Paenibacillus rhizovicinus]
MSISPYLPLIAALTAIVVAQLIKVPIYLFANFRFDLKLAVSTGGMPSSHSAAVTALIAGIGIKEGLSSSFFAIAALFGIITMYDAAGIRRHAGMHASLINRMSRRMELFQQQEQEQPWLKEMLGHRPIEVLAGALLGIVICLLLQLVMS